jgi:hypothetical protein
MGFRVAHAGLRAEVDDAVEIQSLQALKQPIFGEIRFDHMEAVAMVLAQLRDPVALELHAVIIVEIIEADDRLATREQPLADMKADKAGRAGHQGRH